MSTERGRFNARYDGGGTFKVEVIADNSGKWAGNALTFDTVEDAEAYAKDLFSRWTLVREWRVVPVETTETTETTGN